MRWWVLCAAGVACSGEEGTKPTVPEKPEDVPVEPCNGEDDDEDGFVDEGNDVDADGVPDCFDAEECDGLDNDGNGVVDDGFDIDGDEVGDCLDVEDCDGVDNDGDGAIDEDFPDGCDPCDGVDNDGDGATDEDDDVDGDGIGDCLDVEECDEVDNDGDGLVDEGIDLDWDGVCDALDVEACDGWDNDGDGLRDEGFDADADGLPDCWVPELCNGVDDDGDGELDEGFADDDDDGIPDCRAACGAPAEWTRCAWDTATSDFLCTYQDPLDIASRFMGTVVDADLAGWDTLVVIGEVDAGSGFLWHVADSETCNGYGGDAGTSAYDGEAHADVGGGVYVYDGQLGFAAPLLLSGPAVDFASDHVAVQVCAGWFGYTSEAYPDPLEASSPHLFQWDPLAVDSESVSGFNDTLLHLGLNRTVGDPSRAGSGLQGVEVWLGR